MEDVVIGTFVADVRETLHEWIDEELNCAQVITSAQLPDSIDHVFCYSINGNVNRVATRLAWTALKVNKWGHLPKFKSRRRKYLHWRRSPSAQRAGAFRNRVRGSSWRQCGWRPRISHQFRPTWHWWEGTGSKARLGRDLWCDRDLESVHRRNRKCENPKSDQYNGHQLDRHQILSKTLKNFFF